MCETDAISLARAFKKIDPSYKKADRNVQDLINEGYTPDEALMLAGFGGYGLDN